MKILFSMLHPGYVRNYEPALRLLAESGHEILLGFEITKKQASDRLAEALAREFPNVSVLPTDLPKRKDGWAGVAALLRGVLDYSRYFDPRFEDAILLRERVRSRIALASPTAVRIAEACRSERRRLHLQRWLVELDEALPLDPRITEFLRTKAPDVVLVTPLVNYASRQMDLVRHAQRLGCRLAVCVASWDNLTNKGLLRCQPDRVVLWNEAQKREAVELHGIAPESVVVTGAQPFDRWFEHAPSTTREAFCANVGLDPHRPFVLYLASSPFIGASREVGFVRRWIEGLRALDGQPLSQVGVLVRPHPQNAHPWAAVDFADLGNVAIYPRAGANPVSEGTRNEFFDSIFHSFAVVGVNTSAQIEAGIVGRPVFTVRAEEFAGTQDGTLHFHHLVDGGLLNVAPDLPSHYEQLARCMSDPSPFHARASEFLASFVRPHGLDRKAAPLVAEAVEALGSEPAPAPRRGRMGDPLRRLLLRPLKIAADGTAAKRRIERERQRQLDARRAPSRLAVRTVRLLFGAVAWLLGALGLKELVRRHVLPRLVAAASVGDEEALRGGRGGSLGKQTWIEKQAVPVIIADNDMRRAMKRIAASSDTILVGPWLSEVGFEVLYWIPFLQWASVHFNLDPRRMVSLTRGGAGIWYEHVCSRHLDAFDFLSAEDFRDKLQERWTETGGQKQTYRAPLDDELIARAKERLGVSQVELVHPGLMYNLFRSFWRGRAPIDLVLGRTSHERMKAPALPGDVAADLPQSFVAVRFYFRPSFPDTPENRGFTARIVDGLAQRSDVVLLNPGFTIDDHEDFDPSLAKRVHRLDGRMTARDNLAVQSAVIARASAFVGTYGGLSYLAPLYGVPSLSFYSAAEHFLPAHLAAAQTIFHESPASFLALHVRDAALVQSSLSALGRPSLVSVAASAVSAA
jgi:hypothetical protein